MRITADTNILVRVVTADDEAQRVLATRALKSADVVAIGIASLCELVWVLDKNYGVSRADIGQAIRGLTDAKNVSVNRPAIEAGLHVLDAGGDFADGAIAYEGRWLGGDIFVSFDRKAVKRLADQGHAATLLA